MKRCNRCGSVKPLDEFSLQKGRKNGRQAWCKLCKADYRKLRYKPLNDTTNPRKSTCLCCGKDFVLLSKKRKYCSNLCRSNYNSTSLKRVEWYECNQEKMMLSRVKSYAKLKGLPFSLEESDIVIPDKCPVLGLTLQKNKDQAGPNSPSLDKIVPNLGYIKGNVRVISQRANLLKSDASLEELRLIYEDALTLHKNPDTTILEETA